jgi:hypothetical protein
MDQQTFERDIFGKVRVNNIGALLTSIEQMRASMLHRATIQMPGRLDFLDVYSLSTLAASGTLSERERATLAAISPDFYERLLLLNELTTAIQRDLSTLRRNDPGKLKDIITNCLN